MSDDDGVAMCRPPLTLLKQVDGNQMQLHNHTTDAAACQFIIKLGKIYIQGNNSVFPPQTAPEATQLTPSLGQR